MASVRLSICLSVPSALTVTHQEAADVKAKSKGVDLYNA